MTTTPQTEAMRLADATSEDMREWFDGTARFLMTMQRGKAIVDELRRLDAENTQQKADLERKSDAIQRLWAERDQLRAQVERLQGGEPVAVIGSGWTFLWASGDAIEDIVKRHGLKIGSKLYTAQPAAPEMVALSERIKELIAEHGTLRSVARVLNIDVGYLSRLEHGEKVSPSPEVLAKLGLRDAGAMYVRLGIGQPAGGEG